LCGKCSEPFPRIHEEQTEIGREKVFNYALYFNSTCIVILIGNFSIMADKFGTIFCTAIRHGGQEEWKSAWKKSTDPQWVLQREKIMSALTCSRDEKRLKKLLRRIHDDIIPADSKSGSNPIVLVVLEGMLSSNDSIAPSLARQFIKSNRKNLQKM